MVVGALDGFLVGELVRMVGRLLVGRFVGLNVVGALLLGLRDGTVDGRMVVGTRDGFVLGLQVRLGIAEGTVVGRLLVGSADGFGVGMWLSFADGAVVGKEVGLTVGAVLIG